MLSELKIKNFALIESLETTFPDGFITVTGETGAGKSIILGALGLLSGNRADTKALRDKDQKAVIEATFRSSSAALVPLLEKHGLDPMDDEIILRREIAPSGRSRAFINDSPVNLQVLAEVAPALLDIHSQHNNLLLSDPRHQRSIIDSYGDYSALLESCSADFKEFIKVHSRLTKLKAESESMRQNAALMRFQLSQLEELDLRKGETAELERTSRLLSEAEDMRIGLSSALNAIEADEQSAMSRVGEAVSALRNINLSLIETGDDISVISRLETLAIELKDIAYLIDQYLSKTESDPARLEKTDRRIARIYEVAKGFQTADPESLIEMREELSQRLLSIDGNNPELKSLKAKAAALATGLHDTADRITSAREDTATRFAAKLTEICRPLGLPNLRFEVGFSKGKIGAEGQDNIEFLCAFNKNQPLMPLAKVASGGEISRVMLAIKALVAEKMQLPTMIFDEIDAGVSGEIASRMGELMRSLADDMQIITVTHLPQVAAAGTAQFHVYKEDTENATLTRIRRLTPEERVDEIARILSGNTINQAAMMNARELLNTN